MSDSGPPKHWPFNMFDPALFKVPERQVTKVFLHCSAWNGLAIGHKLAETINEWHLANGWSGIGYHYVIDHLGSICTARPLEDTPAAQLGPDKKGNTGTIAIMTNGLWEFTAEALKSTYMLCSAINDAYKLSNRAVTFHGHCEIDPKPCPVYDYRNLLGLNENGVMMNPPIGAEAVAQRARDKALER